MDTAEILKQRYSNSWAFSKQKEEHVRDLIEAGSGRKLRPLGLGAGSSSYVAGSSQSNRRPQAEPDYLVEGSRVKIEVTGFNKPPRSPGQDPWLNTYKLKSAINDPDHLHVIIDVELNGQGLEDATLRSYQLNPDLIAKYLKDGYEHKEITIGSGVKQYFVVIPLADQAVLTWEELMVLLRDYPRSREIMETFREYDCPACGHGCSNYVGPVGYAKYQFSCRKCGQVYNVFYKS